MSDYRVVAVLSLSGLVGCKAFSPEFRCHSDSACMLASSQGICEPDGHCSAADSSCDSGRRYYQLSGPVSRMCVGAASDMTVGGSSDMAASADMGASADMVAPADGAVAVATSCVGGMNHICGGSGTGDCCQSLLVAGGTYNRSNDSTYPATVSDFRLDKYEITVGRFRAFVNAGMGTQARPPADGAGAHPLISGSGWDATFNASLSADTATLKTGLKSTCCGSWTDSPSPNENLPITNITWYEAFAFCAWDGGFLPTEAEWNYAAGGGSEQRQYPWSNPPSSTTIDPSYAVYTPTGSPSTTPMAFVGSKSPKGDGKWGQADLAGNAWEWTLDWSAAPYGNPCVNCADLFAATDRVRRGGAFDYGPPQLLSSYRGFGGPSPSYRWYSYDARCARTP